MSKKKVPLTICIILLFPIALFVLKQLYYALLTVTVLGGFPTPSIRSLERYLIQNIDLMQSVVSVLSELELDYYSVQISNENPVILGYTYSEASVAGENEFVFSGEYAPDSESALINVLGQLHAIGVTNVSIHRNNSVRFVVWSALNESRGLIHSLSGEKVAESGQIVDIRPMTIDGWYYYESNFEKWKARNPELFE